VERQDPAFYINGCQHKILNAVIYRASCFFDGGKLMMKYWAIFFSIFMIAIVALADTGHLGKLWLIYSFPGGHWVGHFVLFGLLSFVIDLSLFEERPLMDRGKLASMAGLVIALFVGLEEFSQRFLPTRHSSPVDFVFSCLGIAFFSWLAVFLKTTSIRKQ